MCFVKVELCKTSSFASKKAQLPSFCVTVCKCRTSKTSSLQGTPILGTSQFPINLCSRNSVTSLIGADVLNDKEIIKSTLSGHTLNIPSWKVVLMQLSQGRNVFNSLTTFG